MTSKRSLALRKAERSDDAHALFDAEWDERTWPSHVSEFEALDAEPASSGLYLPRDGVEVPGQVGGVDARRQVGAMIHNSFFVAGKVPSLNELLDAKAGGAPIVRSIIMRATKGKGKQRGAHYTAYNDIKQDWTRRTMRSLPAHVARVEAAYFGYVIVEESLRRDPSNVCSAAIKFIEDGLVKAKVMPNDGWKNVLGIRMVAIHRPGRDPGVFVVLSDGPLDEQELVHRYEDHVLAELVLSHSPKALHEPPERR